MTCFPKVSKMAIFRKIANGGTKGKKFSCFKMAIFRKMAEGGPKENFPDFLLQLRKAKKIGNTSPILA